MPLTPEQKREQYIAKRERASPIEALPPLVRETFEAPLPIKEPVPPPIEEPIPTAAKPPTEPTPPPKPYTSRKEALKDLTRIQKGIDVNALYIYKGEHIQGSKLRGIIGAEITRVKEMPPFKTLPSGITVSYLGMEKGLNIPSEPTRIIEPSPVGLSHVSDIDLGRKQRPKQPEAFPDQLTIIEREAAKEVGLDYLTGPSLVVGRREAEYETAKYLEKQISEKVSVLKGWMTSPDPVERLKSLGWWISSSFTAHDPWGVPSTAKVLVGDWEGAIRVKAGAMGELEKASKSPDFMGFWWQSAGGTIVPAYATWYATAGLGAGIGGFKATSWGQKALLVSRGAWETGTKAGKPLWTLTAGGLVEKGIFGGVGVVTAKELGGAYLSGDMERFYSGVLQIGIHLPVVVGGYKAGYEWGYGRVEQYLYGIHTYTPGTPEYIRYQQALKVSRTLKDVLPHKMKPLDFAKDIMRMDTKTAQQFIQYYQTHGGVIGGSAASYTQIFGARQPRDIDYFLQRFLFGTEVQVTQAKRVLPTITKTGRHLIDIHGKEMYSPSKYYRFGFVSQKPVKIGGYKYFTGGEQLFRKGITSVIVESQYRWFKDIPDFITHARSLIGTLKQKWSPLAQARATKAEVALELFLHPEKAITYGKTELGTVGRFFKWMGKPTQPEMVYTPLGYEYVYPTTAYPSYLTGVSLSYLPSMTMDYIPSVVSGYKPIVSFGYKPSPPVTYKPAVKIEYELAGGYPVKPIDRLLPPIYPQQFTVKELPSIETAPPYKPPTYPGYPTPDYIPPLPPHKPSEYDYYGDYDYEKAFPPIPHRMRIDESGERLVVREPEERGFNVYIKERYIFEGKKRKPERFARVKTPPLSEGDALAFGGYLTDQSTARSFKIVPTEKKAQPLKHNIPTWGLLGGKFYQKKVGQEIIYIESNLFAIDQEPELQGITFKGVLASMQKRHIAEPRKPRVVKEKQAPFDMDVFDIDMDIGKDIDRAINKMLKGRGLFG